MSPENLHACAYTDEDLQIAENRFLIEPQVHARLLQALELTGREAVLDVGFGLGYSSAILSKLCSTVIAIEDNQDLLNSGQKTWHEQAVTTVVGYKAPLLDGYKEASPYDAIFVNGALGRRPDELITQLEKGGRLACILCENTKSGGKAMMYHKKDGVVCERTLFDAFVPVLPGCEAKNEFVF